jgi:hypothetical protein
MADGIGESVLATSEATVVDEGPEARSGQGDRIPCEANGQQAFSRAQDGMGPDHDGTMMSRCRPGAPFEGLSPLVSR